MATLQVVLDGRNGELSFLLRKKQQLITYEYLKWEQACGIEGKSFVSIFNPERSRPGGRVMGGYTVWSQALN